MKNIKTNLTEKKVGPNWAKEKSKRKQHEPLLKGCKILHNTSSCMINSLTPENLQILIT